MYGRLTELSRVQAHDFSGKDTDYQVKFASSKPMRTQVLGDRPRVYSINASSLTESVHVSTSEPSCNESILTTYIREVRVLIHSCR